MSQHVTCYVMTIFFSNPISTLSYCSEKELLCLKLKRNRWLYRSQAVNHQDLCVIIFCKIMLVIMISIATDCPVDSSTK
ncbi:conserved hypothetical protein [Xenorhabdus nematophila F1]|uniref:Uncharacterized protein n=1 Tax=Xenorhabdus nematophila (strain ATCC 19061 / DSM 3370 / CCUG 14189 / LMG 1036 / NCIMB 9965 / AN6) TaxID=406817 RepID=D3VJZ6_XENNA|nr:hypothetical protein D3790_00235 [Xenorhabdus nematophila]MCB4427017.1 hypothetical protein [Xenorhabdus nematophila]CBJ91055.1 hypothetical protein XNC1_3001 [Xenorhabdus nematophila ATCC 19061]CCW31974.1 conserved hypothetical protein [Xenorhabdus nematophila F1]CEK23877.1 hypothetical protein XNC2_2883 [Xenorhabdus nematophila AN6/1]